MTTVRPNVVVIYMDDMTHWALRSSQVLTPNLDALRARGTVFTHAFNQGSLEPAVCTPARQMLLSGKTLFGIEKHLMEAERLGQVFTREGYASYFTGKWHNEHEALESDYEEVGPWAGGMLPSTEMEGDAYGRPAEGNDWSPADPRGGGHWMQDDDGSVVHSSERWANAAVRFLDGAPEDRPFFLHLAFHAPHDPRQSPQKYLDLYNEDEVRVPENFMTEHPFDNGELRIRDEVLAPFPRTHEAVRLHRHEYFALLSHADAQIGRVLDAIDARGARENTVIVFSGDHGLALGEHGLMGKQNLYDHSVRVPLLLVGPGVPIGEERDALVYSGSILATLCDLTGLPTPVDAEFSSLVPTLLGERNGEDVIFGAYRLEQRMVRTKTHKLIRYAWSEHNQLFDMIEDSWELDNRYDDPELSGVRDVLSRELDRQQHALGDPLTRAG